MLLTPVLTPVTATLIFVAGCLAGYQYRRTWKAGGARWKLWLYGMVAAAALLTLGFVPMVAPAS
ncbi:hypothetical protein ABFB10_15030 [Ponticoccus litoralis]|uniref:Uncharacterized protein n=1 Tax=Ponticoccus litoralis TaxID=422297 RepID=A0AAW9SBB9_9RHOB